MNPSDSTLNDPVSFIDRILTKLHEHNIHHPAYLKPAALDAVYPSSVLFLVGPHGDDSAMADEICLILNKRSAAVKQPGDLCCPGGGISPKIDGFYSKLLQIPGSPLRRWPHWRAWRKDHPEHAETLKLFLASGLREGYEEMRLNPLGIQFLGPLPLQQLAMFRRDIYPLACWVTRQKQFSLNWEVDKLVYIPVKSMLDPKNYACYRLNSDPPRKHWGNTTEMDFLCFVQNAERLWGATFRITMTFLDIVFGFKPPDVSTLPVIHGNLDRFYATGNPGRI